MSLARDGSSLVELAEGELHVEQRDASQKEHQDISDQERTCTLITQFITLFRHTMF